MHQKTATLSLMLVALGACTPPGPAGTSSSSSSGSPASSSAASSSSAAASSSSGASTSVGASSSSSSGGVITDGGMGDGGVPQGDGGTSDAGVVPGIADVVSCREVGGAGGLQAGTDMQRHDLDLSVFPDAICNDGTGAVLYFRPAASAATEGKWIIQLEGGGACPNGTECAKRWCKLGTNFSSIKMSSDSAPANGIERDGILGQPLMGSGPWTDWNQVFVRYCSSDSWSGEARDRILSGEDPVTNQPITYRLHFLGARIFDAAISTLRRDGVAALAFQGPNGSRTLPDLDDAEEVILAGASAGGSGTIANLDHLNDMLRQHNSACQDGACPLVVRGLIDSIFAPALESLDFSTTRVCPDGGACTYAEFYQDETTVGRNASWEARSDVSCESWHTANQPGTEWACADLGHVVRNHITTPFFIRMGQRDQLISSNMLEFGYTVPDAGPLTLDLFAQLVREQVAALADIQTSAHEGAQISTVPGGFSPVCPDHETIGNTRSAYATTIEHNGMDLNMFDVWDHWLAGTSPSILITQPGGVNFCP